MINREKKRNISSANDVWATHVLVRQSTNTQTSYPDDNDVKDVSSSACHAMTQWSEHGVNAFQQNKSEKHYWNTQTKGLKRSRSTQGSVFSSPNFAHDKDCQFSYSYKKIGDGQVD